MVLNHTIRLVNVCYPAKRRAFCSLKAFIKILITILISSLILNSHFIWTSSIIDSKCYSFAEIRFVLIGLTVLFDTFIPNMILIIFNIKIIHKLKKVRNKSGKISSRRNPLSAVLVRKFIVNSLVFILLFLPLRASNLYVVLYPEAENDESIVYMRKIFSLLVCSYYSLYFLVHIFIIKHVRQTLHRVIQERDIVYNKRKKAMRLVPLKNDGVLF
jgi:hypothetical protein